VYPFESIQQTKGVTPAQGHNGPPPVEVVKYVTICNEIMLFPPRGGGTQYWIFSAIVFYFLHAVEKTKTPLPNPFLVFQATLVHLPYGW